MRYSIPPKEENDDMESTHSAALVAKHAGLDARITAERQRPAPDTTLLARLKKQKLKIKEMIVRA